jgi:hypothetical protein
MTKPAIAPPPAPFTLTQQKSDFTAEGSPPPGKVSGTTPVTVPEDASALPAGKPRLRGTIKAKRASQHR